MDQEAKFSKKQLKELRKLEKLEKENLERKQDLIKWVTISVSAILFLVIFGAIVFFAKQGKTQQVPTTLSSSGWVRGGGSAKLTLVEFSDFQCPACRAYEPMVQNILKDYNGRVKLLYKHFPLSSNHKNAIPAAQAAEAAGRQNKFWEMHDSLFEKQDEWATSNVASQLFETYAKALGLDIGKFKNDYNSPDLETKIKAEQDEGIKVGVNSTPTFFINGKMIQNPRAYEDFKKLVEKELAK